VVWQRFGDETKPGEEFYGTPAKGNSR
jgi:hypothetical protein